MKRSILLLLFLLAVLALAGLFLFFRPLWFSGAGMVLVAAPDGQGEACTLFRPCSLATAQQQARQAQPKGDLLVYLREGVYPLSET